MTATAPPPQTPPRAGVLREFVPGIALFRSYQRGWLGKDLVAGLVLSALLVPQGMAYAELAGLPPVTGLYTSILCLVGYAIFGPSRILVLGPDSSLGPMIAATIAPLVLAGGDPDKAVALASVLAVLVGVVMTVAGLGHLGFVADLLSKPTQIGYMNGLALTIVVGQLPKLFGFSVDADGLIEEAKAFVTGVADQLVTPPPPTIGVLSLVGILLMQRLMPKIPAVLVVVVLAALAVNLLDLQDDGVKTIGVLPQGFPPFTIPTVAWGDLPELFLGAVAISVVALADTMSTASSFAARRGERVRGDQEMIGIGAANIFAGPLPGLPGEHERVAHRGLRAGRLALAGDRHRRRGRHRLRPGVRDRGHAVRAAADPGRHRHRRRALAGRPAGDATPLAPAPHRVHALDRGVPRRRAARRAARHPARHHAVDPQRVPAGLVAAPGRARPGRGARRPARHRHLPALRAAARAGRLPVRRPADLRQLADVRRRVRAMAEERPDLRWVVVAAEPMTDVDTTAADMLAELDSWLNARDVSLVFAEVKDPVRAKIVRYELERTIDPAHFFPTVDEAVAAYMAETGETWRDPARDS